MSNEAQEIKVLRNAQQALRADLSVIWETLNLLQSKIDALEAHPENAPLSKPTASVEEAAAADSKSVQRSLSPRLHLELKLLQKLLEKAMSSKMLQAETGIAQRRVQDVLKGLEPLVVNKHASTGRVYKILPAQEAVARMKIKELQELLGEVVQ